MRSISLLFIVFFVVNSSFSQKNKVQIYCNLEHKVGNISQFDRKKFITLHASLTESDWNGEEDKMEYLLDDLDVYLGRDNGFMGWYMNQSSEDTRRPGFVSPTYMRNRGKFVRETVYGINNSEKHKYEDKADVMIGGQERPFWPGTVTNPCCADTAYEIASAEAVGDYMGQFLNRFYRNNGEPSTKGMPKPRFLEVINEPLYGLITNGDHTPVEVFEYHNKVANAIRLHNSDVLIGGYTAAFPYFDVNNFETWENEMKLFVDTSGKSMDYFSLHYYDFNKHHFDSGRRFAGPINYKGSRLEASLDMVEHYSKLSLGEVKPLLISEYGGRDHSNEWKPWSPDRDWSFMKSYSPLMMQFMKRPDRMLKTIPFIVNKAEWGRTNVPYGPRLMRQAFEAAGETGEHWVFSGLVKFYELWANVNGKRVLTKTNNNEILTDTYIDGNKIYIALSNLAFKDEDLHLNIEGISTDAIGSITAKHLYGNTQSLPILETTTINLIQGDINFNLKAEATAIIEITLSDTHEITEIVNETSYYASNYKQAIVANNPISFSFSEVLNSENTYAMLRIGVGRKHDKNLFPVVTLNGKVLESPSNYSGDPQTLRKGFFGLLEIPIRNDQIGATNTVEVTFPDTGGFISSMVMQVFDPSVNLSALSNETILPKSSDLLKIYPNPSKNGKLIANTSSTRISTLKIFSIDGALLLSETVYNEQEIDVSSIASGVYFLEIKTGSKAKVFKWIVE